MANNFGWQYYGLMQAGCRGFATQKASSSNILSLDADAETPQTNDVPYGFGLPHNLTDRRHFAKI
jgi:hypothetical protein